MKRLHKKFHVFMRSDYLIMNFSKNQHILTFYEHRKKIKNPFLTHAQSATETGRWGLWSAHSAPALTTARTAYNRRVLADGDLAGDETCTYVFPSTSRTRLGYRLNELEPHTTSPAAMAAWRRRAR